MKVFSRHQLFATEWNDMTTTTTIPSGRISELVRYFLRLGFLGFGGPVALVGQMERELVDEQRCFPDTLFGSTANPRQRLYFPST